MAASQPLKIGLAWIGTSGMAERVTCGFKKNPIKPAQSVVTMPAKGKTIKNVPVKIDTDPKFILNETAVQRLKLEIPHEILQAATIVKQFTSPEIIQ
ncbi:MAG: hypothetical protein GY868_12990 [Deltaproteobacteria bacterium]|nr:hypothetical protein [Deltaproteobacteria bacterium]